MESGEKRFLVRRRGGSEIDDLARFARRTTPEARTEQIKQIQEIRKREAPFAEVETWLLDHGLHPAAPKPVDESMVALFLGTEPIRYSGPPSSETSGWIRPVPMTRTAVVALPADKAGKFTADLSEYDVQEDLALSLIEPVEAQAAGEDPDGSASAWAREMIKADAPRRGAFSGAGIGVAVLDTGVDSHHPALEGRVVEQVTWDANGTLVTDPVPQDTASHGTHVAGIIAGKNIGVAPAAKIHSAVMIPEGRGTLSSFLLALAWASLNPSVQVVNISAGLRGFHPAMLEDVRGFIASGIIPVIAIGNEGRSRTRSPGNYDVPLSVGACDRRGRVASFSGGGTIHHQSHAYHVPDMVAPGVRVHSCVPDNKYAVLSGSSMATPMVSGIAALLMEQYPKSTVHDILDAVVTTCKDLGHPRERQGAGLVDYEAASRYLA